MKLVENPDLLNILENDLMVKAHAALDANGVLSVVHGVFSIDDLEDKQEKDLDGRLAVGVGYQGCKPKEEKSNPAGGNIAAMAEYFYTILFAVPVGLSDDQRITATKILTILRMSIFGSAVVSEDRRDKYQRKWEFVQEKPEIADSTETMLYYTQVWRLSMPVVSN